MVKLFGFMLALAAMISSANAALLVSYEFNSSADEPLDPTSSLPEINASSATGNYSAVSDRIQSSVNNLTNIRSETFEFSPTGSNLVKLSTMTFDAVAVSGTRTIGFTPTFKLDGTTVSSSLYSVTGSGFGVYTVSFTSPLEIASGVSFEAIIAGQGTSAGNNTTFGLDNVKFDGQLVPEPASMAIFGLLGVGAAARRYRRKK